MQDKYLYLLLYPNPSLIASQLDPARFAQHYVQGSTGFYGGNFLFVEVDPSFRHEYFKIDAAYERLIPHEDGRPKATKFVCNYRTLEHMDLDCFKNLYYCNALGNFIELQASEYDPSARGDEMRILIDINPTKMTILSRHNFYDYGVLSIDPKSFVSSPAILYTQVDYDLDDFLARFAINPFLPLKIPGIHPARLRYSILEVRSTPTKKNKGILLDCPFDKISYRSLRRGFMFFTQEKNKFYPLIPMDVVEKDFYQFWKTM